MPVPFPLFCSHAYSVSAAGTCIISSGFVGFAGDGGYAYVDANDANDCELGCVLDVRCLAYTYTTACMLHDGTSAYQVCTTHTTSTGAILEAIQESEVPP